MCYTPSVVITSHLHWVTEAYEFDPAGKRVFRGWYEWMVIDPSVEITKWKGWWVLHTNCSRALLLSNCLTLSKDVRVRIDLVIPA